MTEEGLRNLLIDISEAINMAVEAIDEKDKMGHWIIQYTELGKCCVCSECGGCPNIAYRYCPYCGAKMQEVEE